LAQSETRIQYTINIRAPEYVMDSITALNSVPVSGGRAGQANGQILANVADLDRGQVPRFSLTTTSCPSSMFSAA